MRTKILTIVFLFGIISVINAQDNVDKNEMVGFGCYSDGSESKTVEKYSRKIDAKNHKWISKKLNSKNNAERYMSVIILEELTKIGKYELTENELMKIAEIKNSTELVSVCSGCTYFEKIELKNMFTDEMLSMGSYWLNYKLKTE